MFFFGCLVISDGNGLCQMRIVSVMLRRVVSVSCPKKLKGNFQEVFSEILEFTVVIVALMVN